jgi:Amidase
MADLCDHDAVTLAGMLRRREVSAREVVTAHARRIEALDGVINAVVTRSLEMALGHAGRADAELAGGGEPGLLHGLPAAHKDLADTAGVRTTYGSVLFAGHVPDRDDLVVARMAGAGAISLGKTNTPEFGAGSHTVNPVFGATRNPWDPSRSAGGGHHGRMSGGDGGASTGTRPGTRSAWSPADSPACDAGLRAPARPAGKMAAVLSPSWESHSEDLRSAVPRIRLCWHAFATSPVARNSLRAPDQESGNGPAWCMHRRGIATRNRKPDLRAGSRAHVCCHHLLRPHVRLARRSTRAHRPEPGSRAGPHRAARRERVGQIHSAAHPGR